MADIQPYNISVPQDKIDILRTKLSVATFPDELPSESPWDQGPPSSEIQRLTEKMEDLGLEKWPGSFLEVLRILPHLQIPASTSSPYPSFHIVAPSLPNFGFSSGVKKRGFAMAQYAETLNKLMLKLGYNEYVTQAGDWGFWITRAIGKLYPKHCKASHLNMVAANPPSLFSNPIEKVGDMLMPYRYNVLQSTKPQTLAYGLADSPVSLLGWIYEKLHDWSDDYPWCQVGGLAYNPKDLENVPKRWGRTLGSVVYEVENDSGGHFYSHEKPDLLVRDLRAMFGRGGGAFGVVNGRNGYT
ncbi:hypothetical protein DID88_002150 [Monilinia fructigena]|uniref:AB hydrolase-1 domain-containing protein n=1 Tax=Monilinia fructigena TaxID=38457 RepID=A0A395IX06_9HELO|nr:hypothetical protein DID88_002150 [Monilinia fructigena]